MKLLSELYAETISLWSKHHTEIMAHVAQIVEVAATSSNPALGAGVIVGEDVISAIMAKLADLETKVNAIAPQTVLPTSN